MHYEMDLLLNKPMPFFKTLPPIAKNVDSSNNYYACKAAQVNQRNMYVLHHHKTSTAELSGSIYKPLVKGDKDWSARGASFENSYGVDYNIGWIFFSEDEVNLRLTPPYLHRTTAGLSGAVSSGSFYINKWFRPINVSYQLWEGVNSITVTEDEPAAYIEFDTDNEIELIEFKLNKEIYEVANACLNYKAHVPNATLSKIYSKFKTNQIDKKLIPLIKEQLV
jgi:hypothetical protein